LVQNIINEIPTKIQRTTLDPNNPNGITVYEEVNLHEQRTITSADGLYHGGE